jgi:hypothetical protein
MRFSWGLTVLFVAAVSLTPAAARAAALTQPANNLGLAGYWSFNEATGTMAGDSSGNKRAGTLSGGTWAAGKRGSGLSFNGTSDKVSGPSITVGASMTISAWIKKTSSTGQKSFFSNRGGGNVYFGLSGSQVFLYDNAGSPASIVSGSGAVQFGQWQHVVATSNGSTITFYVNGVQVYQTSQARSASTGTFGIGWDPNIASEYWNGSIDEVRLYSRALTAAEVAGLYSQGAAQMRAAGKLGLVGYWPFDEGSGTVAGDMSGNQNNGTLSGSTLPAWAPGKYGKALSFDGSTSYIPISRTVADDFTLSAWIKTTQNAAGCGGQWYCGQGIIDGEVGGVVSDFGMSVYNGKLAFGVGASDITVFSNANVNTGQWVLVTATRVKSTGAMKIYVNGVLDNTGTGGLQSLNAPTTLYIGADANINPSASFLNGLIDDVRIYNRALSDTEVLGLYRQNAAAQINTSSASLTADSPLSSGLVGLWTFDGPDITDKVYDRSGQGNSGYFYGGATSSAKTIGKLGQALLFNGSTNYITVPDSASFDLTNFTASAWIKINGNASGDRRIISQQDSAFWLLHINGNLLTAWLSNDGINGVSKGSVLNDGQWHLVAITRDTINDVVTWWTDGVSVGTQATSNNSGYAIGSPVYIGSYSGMTQFFPGSIDDVRVYSRALSAAEMRQLYLMGN